MHMYQLCPCMLCQVLFESVIIMLVTASTAQKRRGRQAAKLCQGQASARVSLQPQGWGCTHTARQRHSTSHNQPMRHKYIKDSTSPLLLRRALHKRSLSWEHIHTRTACATATAIGKLLPTWQRLFESHHQLHTSTTHPEEWTATEWMQQCNEGVVGHKKNAGSQCQHRHPSIDRPARGQSCTFSPPKLVYTAVFQRAADEYTFVQLLLNPVHTTASCHHSSADNEQQSAHSSKALLLLTTADCWHYSDTELDRALQLLSPPSSIIIVNNITHIPVIAANAHRQYKLHKAMSSCKASMGHSRLICRLHPAVCCINTTQAGKVRVAAPHAITAAAAAGISLLLDAAASIGLRVPLHAATAADARCNGSPAALGCQTCSAS